MNNLRFIFKYIKKYVWLYIAGIATLFVVDLASIYVPKITGIITDGLSDGSFVMADVIRCMLQILVLGLIMTVGRVGWRFFFVGTSRYVERDIRNDLFDHLSLMSARFYQTHNTGDMMSRFTNDLSAIRFAIGPALISLFDGTVMTVMVLCQMIFYVDAGLTAVTMIPMVFIAIGVLIYGKLMHVRYEARQAAMSDLTDFSRESFNGIRLVKSFVREKYRIRKFTLENAKTREKTLDANYLMALFMPCLDLIIELSILVTLVYGGYLTIGGEISVGKFVAYNQYIIMLIWPMIACGDAVNSFSQGAASLERVREIFETRPEITDRNEDEQAAENYEIQLKNLTFTYPDRDDAGVFQINALISQGSTIAIAGRTGCGKTTIAELLLHIYQVNDGMIFIGGKDINDLTRKALRDIISYVPQDDFLFSDTIFNNIIFGTEQAALAKAKADGVTFAKVTAAAEAACIHDSVMEFSDGYETWVGERGVTLSGGQKQRVCIARALLKNAPILILDDALSAVDTKTERRLMENITDYRRGKTNIIIAHRITTLSYADRIMVLDRGRLVQAGSQDQLLSVQGPYRDMYERQQLESEYGEYIDRASN